jgi:hypothetical protein
MTNLGHPSPCFETNLPISEDGFPVVSNESAMNRVAGRRVFAGIAPAQMVTMAEFSQKH